MPAHSAPTSRRQLRTTVLTAVGTALAAVALMVGGSALTASPAGQEPVTTAGPVRLLDAPAAPSPTTTTSAPAVRKSAAPRTSTKPTTTTKKPTTTTTSSDEDDD
ncbi:hypothetical protein [Actinomycetospora termitidis]|uniref:Uncharacterized protein n=1 Tax=Actinomycetospora termitidis TaxID=3053470 RepID=A0ABT7MGA0_9PSEU|nr:hypothetical protein [Actinomycetospora sp. Odt1-22]MDL5158897.1 hypothetical protein [Actinomycetospora sp. Odt1-22]